MIVIAHSYGGIVAGSAIKGFTAPFMQDGNEPAGRVKAFVLIASGFSLTGLSFMDPFFGIPPPSWRKNEQTGFAELVTPPKEMVYHDVPEPDLSNAISELTPQSLKALFEGGEYTYTGWRDVPTWYIGTTQDRGLPVFAQRLEVSCARAMGATVFHVELPSSHSPFLSMPEKVQEILLETIETTQDERPFKAGATSLKKLEAHGFVIPGVRLIAPSTWFTYGVPIVIGRLLGWALNVY